MESQNTQLVGYARVSTTDQDLALQIDALKAYGVEDSWIYRETASGARMDRPVLKRVMKLMREGDTLVVWKFDRLGRSVKGVLEALEQMNARGIRLISITEGLDTGTAMGRMVMTLLVTVAEMERNLIAERTKAGIAAAKAAGKEFGSAHSIRDNPKRLAAVAALLEEGRDLKEMFARDIMKMMNEADPKAKRIKNPETVRRWIRAGCPGLGLDDEPLNGKETG